MRSAVDLPHPDGPTRIRNSPSATVERQVVDRDDAAGVHLGDPVERPDRVAHPLSPWVAMPRTKYRCAAMNRMIIGSMLITLPAINRFVSFACEPWKLASPSCSVNALSLVDRDQRPQEVVPRPQELDHRQRRERRQRQRQHDHEQDLQPRCAVDPRGLLELDRQRAEELREHEDAEHVRQVRHDQRAERVRAGPSASRSGTSGSG